MANTKMRKHVRILWMALYLGLAVAPCAVYGAAGAADTANAAESRDMNTVRALIRQRSDVNATQPDGTTALHWAAHWNDLETVKLLLRAGANAKAANRYGVTPLSEAAAAGSAAMIEALIKAGADPKTPSTADGE